MLDVFSGTGSLGIEALSRGADFAVFIDKSRESTGVIRENLKHTGFFDKALVYCIEAEKAVRELKKGESSFNLVFMDPPYGRNFVPVILDLLSFSGILKDNAKAVCETEADASLPDIAGSFRLFDVRIYGEVKIAFYMYENQDKAK